MHGRRTDAERALALWLKRDIPLAEAVSRTGKSRSTLYDYRKRGQDTLPSLGPQRSYLAASTERAFFAMLSKGIKRGSTFRMRDTLAQLAALHKKDVAAGRVRKPKTPHDQTGFKKYFGRARVAWKDEYPLFPVEPAPERMSGHGGASPEELRRFVLESRGPQTKGLRRPHVWGMDESHASSPLNPRYERVLNSKRSKRPMSVPALPSEHITLIAFTAVGGEYSKVCQMVVQSKTGVPTDVIRAVNEAMPDTLVLNSPSGGTEQSIFFPMLQHWVKKARELDAVYGFGACVFVTHWTHVMRFRSERTPLSRG
jgi:hypothetical protein